MDWHDMSDFICAGLPIFTDIEFLSLHAVNDFFKNWWFFFSSSPPKWLFEFVHFSTTLHSNYCVWKWEVSSVLRKLRHVDINDSISLLPISGYVTKITPMLQKRNPNLLLFQRSDVILASYSASTYGIFSLFSLPFRRSSEEYYSSISSTSLCSSLAGDAASDPRFRELYYQPYLSYFSRFTSQIFVSLEIERTLLTSKYCRWWIQGIVHGHHHEFRKTSFLLFSCRKTNFHFLYDSPSTK